MVVPLGSSTRLSVSANKNIAMNVSRLKKLANANSNVAILEAQATAEAIKMKGEAEVFAIEAKAQAETEQIVKKAETTNILL